MTIRVLVVDDAVVIRKILVDIINADPDLEVVGTASNGRIALAKIEKLRPDIITLDVEMPELDGLETLVELRKTDRRLPVIMFSTLTARGASTTLDALAAGATDYITKPSNVGRTGEAIAQVTRELLPRLKALVPGKFLFPATVATGAPKLRTVAARAPRIAAVVVGCSTGGPVALETMFMGIAGPLAVPMFITQHMPALFTGMLAERLDKRSTTTVVEGEEAMLARPGHAYIAPGGRHMIVRRTAGGLTMHLTDDPLVNFCRPSVDTLFESTAEALGERQLAVMLTGMGQDGLNGTKLLAAAGADVIAQDEATSVVWGMPGAVVRAGLATLVLGIDEIGLAVTRRANANRTLERQTS